MTALRIAIVAALFAAGGAAWFVLGQREEPAASVGSPQPGLMTEEERQAYVKEHVRVVDLKVGPDTKPDSEEPVPGLLRVTGKVINEGDREIDRVVVVVFPKDGKGEVMAIDQQDVIIDLPFEPDEIREFRFQIRDRPGFSGTFDHELR